MQTWAGNRLDIYAWQLIPEQMEQLGLTAEDGLTQVWFVDKQGLLTGGAEAVNQALRYVWWANPVAYLYYVPGLRQIEDWVYQWVAKNRYRLPGATAACALPPKKAD